MSQRVFCEKHDEHGATYTNGRPLLDDRCPLCRAEAAEDALRVADEMWTAAAKVFHSDNRQGHRLDSDMYLRGECVCRWCEGMRAIAKYEKARVASIVTRQAAKTT